MFRPALAQLVIEKWNMRQRPPAISPARGPPDWEDSPLQVDSQYDPLAQPEPDYEFRPTH